MSIIEEAIKQAQLKLLRKHENSASPHQTIERPHAAPAARAELSSVSTPRPAAQKAATPAPAAPAQEVNPQYSLTTGVNVEDDLLEEHRILRANSPMRMRDAYNLLRTQILEKTRHRNANTIMVTSPGQGEGKTLTAINLAISISAHAQQTALLVDMNLRSPKVSEYLGLGSRKGVSDFFLRGGNVGDLLINPGIGKLVVLPAGEAITGSTEIISSPKMLTLVQELKSRYPDRYVIYDCPHLIDMPDAHLFTSYVDSVLLVCSQGDTSRDNVQAAAELLVNREVLGVVYNKAP